MYRWRKSRLEVFLAHPGGPYFAKKDEGDWSVPKGEVDGDEELLETACREFEEETGQSVPPNTQFLDLGMIQQKGGKFVHAWAFEGDWDDSRPLKSNTFKLEWPPGSGKKQSFPEIDRAEFFSLSKARRKLKQSQVPLIDRLETALSSVIIDN